MPNFEDLVLKDIQANRPAAAKPGRLFYNETTSTLERDSGTVWEEIEGGSDSIPADGWILDENTWTYDSADDPVFVAAVDADMTGILQPGMRIKLTQTTEKFFIVVAVGAFSGGETLITLYGGTDYDLANAAITLPYYSPVKAPFGFPISPLKWTVELKDTSARTQATPAAGTWYNPGSLSISIPIGAWRVFYRCTPRNDDVGIANLRVYTTLSTANNTESDADMTCYSGISHTSTTATVLQSWHTNEKFLLLAAKTSYFLNIKTSIANTDNVTINGDQTPTIVRAICAYL